MAASPKEVLMYNPASMEPLGPGRTSPDTPQTVLQKVAVARAAQKEFGTTSFELRKRVLLRISQFIVEHMDEITALSVKDSGKTTMDAHYGELFPVLEKIKFLVEHGEEALSREYRPTGTLVHKTAYVDYSPLGTIGIIAPFNWPFHNIMCPVLPVLFAGNSAVIKVSEWTTYSMEYYGNILKDALAAEGCSRDLVQFVVGWGDVGEALVTSGVDKIFFTGSPENGIKVMEAASRNLTPVVLELGGKDAMIICDDCNVNHAVAQAMLGIFTSCGQMCVGTERYYVFEAVYDQFINEVVRRVGLMTQGVPEPGGKCDIGATTMPRQVDIIESLVNDALAKGARALTGGKRGKGKGHFFEPTVLVDVTHDMRIMKEEHFGPVMVVMKVKSDDEALALANDCRYGLGSSVFTGSSARAAFYSKNIRAGMCVINDYGISYVCQSLPFGGVGRSGFGRINGKEGLRECCHVKAVLEDKLPFSIQLPKVWQYPIPQEDAVKLAQKIIRMGYSDSVLDRTSAAFGIIPMLSKL